jgi:hypothetical protein
MWPIVFYPELIEYWEKGNEWLRHYTPFLLLVFGILLIALVAQLLGTRSVRREVPMTRQERRDYLRSMVSDMITDGLEEKYNRGKITKEEKTLWYRKLSGAGLGELLPRNTPARQQTLKENIMERLGIASAKEAKDKLPKPEFQPKSKIGSILFRSTK